MAITHRKTILVNTAAALTAFQLMLPPSASIIASSAALSTAALTSTSCSKVTVTTAPEFNNPPQVGIDKNDGRFHVGFAAKVGEQFTITLRDAQAPILGENTTVVLGPEDKNVTTRQGNGVVMSGRINRDESGRPYLTASLMYTLTFRTAVQGGEEAAGSKFESGTPVVVLGETRHVSTPYLERQSGEIHLGDMPIRQFISVGQEAKKPWKEPSSVSPGNSPVLIFANVIATRNDEDVFGHDKWQASLKFGTETPSGRHVVSTPTMLTNGVTYGVQFPDSEQADFGVFRLHVEPQSISQNIVFCSALLNSAEIFPNPGADTITQSRYGKGFSVSVERDGERVQSLTFTIPILQTAENIELAVLNRDSFKVSFTENLESQNPNDMVVVFSSNYMPAK